MSYDGRRIVVTGGGGAGMGAALVTEAIAQGAEVHVLDRKEPPVAVASHQDVDLTDPDAMAAAVDTIGGSIDALFNCVGVAGPPVVSELVTMLVNFAGIRHLTELVVERMGAGGAVATITSTAGIAWQERRDQWLELLATDGFDEATAWCEAHPDAIATGYKPSKEAATAWTMYACNALGARGIRINCTMPGPTDTPLLPNFKQRTGDFLDRMPIPLGRFQTPLEQAQALLFLNSPAASGITGTALVVDGGTMGAVSAGTVTMPELKVTT
jgi:NAD(P)-dependent dehydrogenase (short-subunit alcohol dehydrogenase family)